MADELNDLECVDLRPGDWVQLRSDGPGMTVVDVGRHTGLAVCEWWESVPLAPPFPEYRGEEQRRYGDRRVGLFVPTQLWRIGPPPRGPVGG